MVPWTRTLTGSPELSPSPFKSQLTTHLSVPALDFTAWCPGPAQLRYVWLPGPGADHLRGSSITRTNAVFIQAPSQDPPVCSSTRLYCMVSRTRTLTGQRSLAVHGPGNLEPTTYGSSITRPNAVFIQAPSQDPPVSSSSGLQLWVSCPAAAFPRQIGRAGHDCRHVACSLGDGSAHDDDASNSAA